MKVLKIDKKVTFYPFYSSSWSCSINPYRTGNLSLLLLCFVSAQQAHCLFLLAIPKKTRILFLLADHTASARQGPLLC